MNDPSREPDLRVLSNLERFEKVALLGIVVVAVGVLILWLLRSATAVPSVWLQMKPITAFGMLLAVCSLSLSAPMRSAAARRAGTVAGFVLAALGILFLFTYSGLIQYSLDGWLLRPSPQTAFGFTLTGICLAQIRQSKIRLSLLADVSAIALAVLILFLLGGYVFSVLEFIGIDVSNLTSPQTLFCFILLSCVIGVRRATEGSALAILVNRGIGSQMARLVLPGIVAAPFVVFGLVAYLNETGLVPSNQTRAVAAPLLALAAFSVTAWMGLRTNELERRLRMQSLTDQLTNILNRRGFAAVAEYVMRNAQRSDSSLMAFYFDLDGLKRANDDLGHDVGSLVIKTFADILVATFRKNDVVARIGGDEFVVLAIGAPESVVDVLSRLTRNVSESNAAGVVPGGISYSAGYAELEPGSARNVDDLVAEADQMMYRQKSRKKAA